MKPVVLEGEREKKERKDEAVRSEKPLNLTFLVIKPFKCSAARALGD